MPHKVLRKVSHTSRRQEYSASTRKALLDVAAGLFAEGRLADQSAIALTVPLNAIDSRDGTPSVRRLRGGRIEKVPVALGLRDEVAEKVAIASGVARGDTLLAGGSLTISAGTSVRVAGSN
jgi:hypothetical protein